MLDPKRVLEKPYTYIVTALLVVVLGYFSFTSTPTDIFPNIDIPVVAVVWSYNGASPDIMEKRIVSNVERAYSSSVNDVQHIESQSMTGVSIIKVFLQPGAKTEGAVAQITASSQNILKLLPPGLTPPLVIAFNASSVPILQLGVSSPTLPESKLKDYAQNFIRLQLAAIRGAAVPSPYGGRDRVIMVDLNPAALQSKGLTPIDVASALNVGNLILPSGDIKISNRDYTVSLNSSPTAVKDLNDLPIKQVNGANIYMRDVAFVHDGSAIQTNIVSKGGKPSVLLTVLKSGDASTLDVVNRVKQALPSIRSTLPDGVHLDVVSDQSTFVKASLNSVVNEGITAALLTALMILVFLGSWRSTLIIAVSIPVSLLFSIIFLKLFGQTINVMTLGGLALAIGILVDNSIVTIENIYRNLGQGKNLVRSIVDGCSQIIAPQMVATMAICIVFLPIMVLTGATGSLFKPMALAVIFAMIASFLVANTLVLVLARMLIGPEAHLHAHGHEVVDVQIMRHHHEVAEVRPDQVEALPKPKGDFVWRLHLWFNSYFEKLLDRYRNSIGKAMHRRGALLLGFCGLFVTAGLLLPMLGADFFPTVDSGSFRLHVRGPAGMRLEETRRLFARIERDVSDVIDPKELDLILDNIGLPTGGVNVAYNTTGAIGPADGEIIVKLSEKHGPTAVYLRALRRMFAERYPGVTTFFQPADITTQILNFGLPSPLDVQVVGKDPKNFDVALALSRDLKSVPGAVDVHIHQVVNAPDLHVQSDPSLAHDLGATQRDIANNLLVSLSSSGQVFPNYWVNPASGVSYLVAVQTPQDRQSDLGSLLNVPVSDSIDGSPVPLGNVAQITRQQQPQVINHYDVQPTYDVYVNVQGRDLGGVNGDVQKVVDKYKSKLPHGTSVVVRGQVESMNNSFLGLGLGLVASIFLVYLLLVVNYQSWIDPLIIISALAGSLSGISWFLFITNTPISVPALMGSILCVGVSTANSVLVVNFANERRVLGDDAMTAAVTAGCTRLRPVMMTALAMIIGMMPMALGLGDGGEQNAPLGRAVIGGLVVATVTTMFFVPTLYSILRRGKPNRIEVESELQGEAE